MRTLQREIDLDDKNISPCECREVPEKQCTPIVQRNARPSILLRVYKVLKTLKSDSRLLHLQLRRNSTYYYELSIQRKVIYVTAHRCTGGLKKLDLRSGSQRHRHFVGFFNVGRAPNAIDIS